jgi:hypothetical protein
LGLFLDRLWPIIRPDVNVVPVRPPIRKINSKGTAVLNARGVPGSGGKIREGSRLLRFWVEAPNTNEIGTTLSRARARGRGVRGQPYSAQS